VAAFVADRVHISTPRPPNIDRILAFNRGPFIGAPPTIQPVLPSRAETVLDVRGESDFAEGHVAGAVNVAVEGSSFATRAAFVFDPHDAITIHASSAEQAQRAARGLHAVGFTELEGYFLESETPERLRPVTLDELDGLLADGDVQLLDVREKDERDAGYIPGSRHIPYRQIGAYADELRNGPVATICATGARASIAASILAREGIDARPVLHAGVDDWKAEGKPIVSFRRCGS
jgi:rhodanese-related sulfurtransferase